MPEVLDAMETVSFFVSAIAYTIRGLLHFVRNDKKDIVDSGWGFVRSGNFVAPYFNSYQE